MVLILNPTYSIIPVFSCQLSSLYIHYLRFVQKGKSAEQPTISSSNLLILNIS